MTAPTDLRETAQRFSFTGSFVLDLAHVKEANPEKINAVMIAEIEERIRTAFDADFVLETNVVVEAGEL